MIKVIFESLSSDDVIDKTTTRVTYYDQLIPGDEDNDYMKLCKHLQGHIEYMSPDEYIERCAYDIFGKKTLETTMNGVNKDNVKKYAKLMKDGEKFPLPYLNYADKGQEGRHRALACKELGIDEIPVLIVTYYDFKEELGLPDGIDLWDGNTLHYYDKDGNEKRLYVDRNEDEIKKAINKIKQNGFLSPDEINDFNDENEEENKSDEYIDEYVDDLINEEDIDDELLDLDIDDLLKILKDKDRR